MQLEVSVVLSVDSLLTLDSEEVQVEVWVLVQVVEFVVGSLYAVTDDVLQLLEVQDVSVDWLETVD